MSNAPWRWLLAAVLACACSSTSSERPGNPEAPPIVVRTGAATITQCPNGGSVVSSGPDENGNGVLDDIELVTRTVVCMPGPILPPGVVLRLIAEPPGLNCAAGGTAVQSGPDTNDNGTLDDGEVAHTEYACGQALLTRLAAEPEGANCLAGGVVFFAGRDRNADHVLDPGEVEVTEYDCGDTLSRDVDIKSVADAAALANIRNITGMLTFGSGNFGELDQVSLPRLEHVGGALKTVSFHVSRLSLPALQDVDGTVDLGGQIAAVDFPRLARAGALSVHGGALRDFKGLPALTRVDRDVEIRDTAGLTSIELSNLSIGEDLQVSSNPQLTQVTIALRDEVRFVGITSNAALEAVTLSVAPDLEATAAMEGVQVFTNRKLTHLTLGADLIGSLDISECPSISDLALDVAQFDSDVLIFGITTPFKMALSAPRGASEIEVGGDLAISSALETLTSTIPVIVDDLLVFDKTRLRTLEAGARIASARGGVRFSDNTLLTRIAPFTLGGGLQLINNAKLSGVPLLPLLDPASFEGAVITDNPVLTGVPSLAQVERVQFSIVVANNPMLGQLPFPALRWIDFDLNVLESPGLTSLALPLLEHVSALAIEDNPFLDTVQAPVLVDVPQQLFIFDNLRLRHIVFDALTSAGPFEVDNNPKLPSCEVLAIFAHVTGFHHQSGNDDTATCGDRPRVPNAASR